MVTPLPYLALRDLEPVELSDRPHPAAEIVDEAAAMEGFSIRLKQLTAAERGEPASGLAYAVVRHRRIRGAVRAYPELSRAYVMAWLGIMPMDLDHLISGLHLRGGVGHPGYAESFQGQVERAAQISPYEEHPPAPEGSTEIPAFLRPSPERLVELERFEAARLAYQGIFFANEALIFYGVGLHEVGIVMARAGKPIDEHFYKAALGRDIRKAIRSRSSGGRDAVRAWLSLTREEMERLCFCAECSMPLRRLREIAAAAVKGSAAAS